MEKISDTEFLKLELLDSKVELKNIKYEIDMLNVEYNTKRNILIKNIDKIEAQLNNK